MLENCLCLPRHSRCPGQLQPGSEDQRIPRLPKKADPMQQIIPPTAQSFTGDTCPGGTPPLSPSLSGWNPVNPPPIHPEKGGFHEQWGAGPHNVEETPSAPSPQPGPGSQCQPSPGSPSPEGSSSSKDTGAGGDYSDTQVLFCHRGPACRLWPPPCQHCLNR